MSRLCHPKIPAVTFMGKLFLVDQGLAYMVAVLNYRFSLRRDQNMHQFSTTEVSCLP
jgi:hypothetical protein